MNEFKPYLFSQEDVETGVDPVEILMDSLEHAEDIAQADVIVTKPLAQRWLDNGNYNRKVKEVKVKKYTKDMNDGKWLRINHSIGFDTDGKLNDGQHSLNALIRSVCSCLRMPITVNINKSAMVEAIDHVAARTLPDIITIDEEREVTAKEISIFSASFINSEGRIGSLDGMNFNCMSREIYREKADHYGHRNSLIWTMEQLEGLGKCKKQTIVFANALRAYDYVMRTETDEREAKIQRIVRFIQICHGFEAELNAHEEWAFKLYQYLNNAHLSDRVRESGRINLKRSDTGGKMDAAAGQQQRKNLYLKINNFLNLHMGYEQFDPKAQIRAFSNEFFPYAEEADGMEKRIKERRAKQKEKEHKRQIQEEQAARKRLFKGMSKEEKKEFLSGLTDDETPNDGIKVSDYSKTSTDSKQEEGEGTTA